MKQIAKVLILFTLFTMFGCMKGNRGELTGVPGRKAWFHPQPLGTVYIPTGSFHTGQSDQDIFHSYIQPNKQVTVHSMWMDDTEITNNEYRQFVNYVIDSIARYMLDEPFLKEDEDGNQSINYREKLNMSEYKEDLEDMYFRERERYRNKREFDVRKLWFEYQWLNHQAAAGGDYWGPGRDKYIEKEKIRIFPDTLCWVRDYTYSYNEPMTRVYFWHPKYDDYPVVGVNWHQANAFCYWRTRWMNMYWEQIGQPITEHWRLPTEFEWEYCARGGRENNMYPWGGPYTRNSKGCFLANFKPNRGNYIDDGGLYPVRADSYFPNDYGLYNMAGNVSEWTKSAFDESSNHFTHDLNPDYQYNAKDSDPLTLKRKVIRGGSWKDVAYFIQNGSRTYEYQGYI